MARISYLGERTQQRLLSCPAIESLMSIRHSWFPIFAGVPTATFLVLGFFCGPTADDFAYATWWGQPGFFEAFKTNYFKWQGRYTSSSILFLAGYLSRAVLF